MCNPIDPANKGHNRKTSDAPTEDGFHALNPECLNFGLMIRAYGPIKLEVRGVGGSGIKIKQGSATVINLQPRCVQPSRVSASYQPICAEQIKSLVGLSSKQKNILPGFTGVFGDIHGIGCRNNLTADDDAFHANGDQLAIINHQSVEGFFREGADIRPIDCIGADEHRPKIAGDEPCAVDIIHCIEPVGGAAGDGRPIRAIGAGKNGAVVADGKQRTV